MTEPINWSRYYQQDAEVTDLTSDGDKGAIHRCRFAESLVPRREISTLLDAGCGDGYFGHYISGKRKNLSIVGVDLAARRVQHARARYSEPSFCQGEIFHLPFRSVSFDVVTSIEVLEHLHDPKKALAELARVSKRWVVVTVPYKQQLREFLCPHCGKSYPAYGHIQSFDELRLGKVAQSVGLRVERVRVYYPLHGQTIGLPRWFQRIEALARRLLGGAGSFLGARMAK